MTYKGARITLQNKITVAQDLVGMSMGVGGWEDSGEGYGIVVKHRGLAEPAEDRVEPD